MNKIIIIVIKTFELMLFKLPKGYHVRTKEIIVGIIKANHSHTCVKLFIKISFHIIVTLPLFRINLV